MSTWIMLDAKFNSASNDYAHCILLIDPTTQNMRNTKNMWLITSHFFMYFSFFVQRGPSKVCIVGTPSMENSTNGSTQNLSKYIGRVVEKK